jgi:hypothetical protein
MTANSNPDPIAPEPAGDALSSTPARVEKFNYGVACTSVDFRTIKSRNQFISKVISPLIEAILVPLEKDRREGAGTRYTVNLVIVSETDIERIQ